jgi:uncharacterized protein with NAD-binding domain and iron-sulfur cluster
MTEDALTPPSEEGVVVVAGAGPAGLAAAVVLARAGLEVRLIERSTHVGGKAWSESPAPRSAEHGVHGWWPNYRNFDRLLESAGQPPVSALRPADEATLVRKDGTHCTVEFPFILPSPVALLLHALRHRLISICDIPRLTLLTAHMLAFRHREDYTAYDDISLADLARELGVPRGFLARFLAPFALNFDYAKPERVSAAAILSVAQFAFLHSKNAVRPRWSRRTPATHVFKPLICAIEGKRGRVELGVSLDKVELVDGRVVGVRTSTGGSSGARHVIAAIPTASIPARGFLETDNGEAFVGKSGAQTVAFRNRCTHAGARLEWRGDCFSCPRHHSVFEPDGRVRTGPAAQPLVSLLPRVVGAQTEILGPNEVRKLECSDVIIATDVPGAQEILRTSAGVPNDLVRQVAALGTTPVIVVVRLWFPNEQRTAVGFESAFTPYATFIDNVFHLNRLDPAYDEEGLVLEVHSTRGDGRDDDSILGAVEADLATICPSLAWAKRCDARIQRHDTFTLFSPNGPTRPRVETGIKGLLLAGDWTHSDRPVWMMERAVISGIEAANCILERRCRTPQLVLELTAESRLLRACRWVARLAIRLFPTHFRQRSRQEAPAGANAPSPE